MPQELKPYAEYKPINLLWLLQIPIHWDFVRAKNFLIEQKELVGNCSADYRLLSLTKKGIIYRDMDNAKGKFPKEFDSYKVVGKEDLVLCLFDIDETPRTVGISKYNGMITGAYDIFTSVNVNPNFLYYYYLSIDNIKGLRPLYTGLRKVVKMSVFLAQKTPIPPPTEQDQIVKYLDYKIYKINKLIKAKKREIELLKEQIEFLCFSDLKNGKEIENWNSAFCSHWKRVKAKRIFEEVNLKNHPNEELIAVTQDRGVIYKKDCSQNYVSPTGSFDGLKLVRKEDFVISLRSFQGGIEYSKIRGIVSPAYNIFCLKSKYNQEALRNYFRFLFKTKPFIELLKSLGGGIRDGKNISFSDFSQFYMPIPPDEHLQLLRKITKKYDILQKQSLQLFNLINEYKFSLISNVVTGKIDIRNIIIDDSFKAEGLEVTDDAVEEEQPIDEQ
jgi:type I restriction enzyme S subunit